MEESLPIGQIRAICEKKPCLRTHLEIKSLVEVTKHCRVFKKLLQENSLESHFLCCKYLQYLFFKENQSIFEYGDQSTGCYIILNGKIKVELAHFRKASLQENILESGSFGESALRSEKPRKYSVVCIKDTHLLYLDKSDYLAAIQKSVQNIKDSKISILKRLPLFNTWNNAALARLQTFFHEKTLNRGQKVYSEGEPAQDIFLIKKGVFELYRVIKSPEKCNSRVKSPAKSLLVATYTVGEMLAEEDAFSDEVHQSTCKCAENESELLCISKTDFMRETFNSPELIDYFNARVQRKTQDLVKRKEMRATIQCLPLHSTNKLKKNKICQDLEADRKMRCKLFYPDTSDYSLATKSVATSDRRQTLCDTTRKDSTIEKINTKKLIKNNSHQVLIKFLKSGKFLLGASRRKIFQTVESLKIVSLINKQDSLSSPLKPQNTGDSYQSPLKLFKTS